MPRIERKIRLKPLEPNLRSLPNRETGMLGSGVYGFVNNLTPIFERDSLTVGSFFRALDRYQSRHEDCAFALDDVYRAAVHLGRYRLAVKLVDIVVPFLHAAASLSPVDCIEDVRVTCWEIIDNADKHRRTFT